MRPAGTRSEGEIAPIAAAQTAHTTSINLTLNANMWHPRDDHGENPRAWHA